MGIHSGILLRSSSNPRFKRSSARILTVCGQTIALTLLGAAQRVDATASEDIATQLKTASALHQRADYAHSIPLLKRIVKASPRNYLANLLLGEDLLRSGRPQDALGPLQVASAARPEEVDALDYVVAVAEALGDSATESEALEAGVTRSNGDEKHMLAWANFCLNRFHALQLAFLTSKRGEGSELRIEAWANSEGTEARESLLEQSAAADPEQRGIWGELGIAQLELGMQSQARATLEEAQRREPQEAETVQLEALLAASEGNWQAADERLLTLGARSPAELVKAVGAWPPALLPGPEIGGALWHCIRNTTAPCPLLLAQPRGGEGLSPKELYLEGRWEQLKALPVVATAESSEWVWRGVAHARTGDCPQAIPLLERGLSANDREGSFYLQVCYANEEERIEDKLAEVDNQGALHELKGDMALSVRNDPAGARQEYEEALRLRPNDARLNARLAEAYERLGDSAHARSAALSALAINPRDAPALRTLVQVALAGRNYAEALIRLKQLAAQQPGNAWTQIGLGIAYEQLGQPAEAVHYLRPQLAAGYPDPKGALHAQLAIALKKLGRTEEAKKAAAEASRLANASLELHEEENIDAP